MSQNARPAAVKTNGAATPAMRVLCVTADLRTADFIEHELKSAAPAHRFEVVPRIDDALQRFEGAQEHDVVLLDTDVSSEDSLRLISALRGRRLPVAIILLVSSLQKDPPLQALEAGADNYVVKRANYTDRLYEILLQSVEHQRDELDRQLHPLQLLVLGDFKQVQQYLEGLSYLKPVAGSIAPDGSLEGLSSTPDRQFPYDLVLIDDAITMPRALQALKDVQMRAPEFQGNAISARPSKSTTLMAT